MVRANSGIVQSHIQPDAHGLHARGLFERLFGGSEGNDTAAPLMERHVLGHRRGVHFAPDVRRGSRGQRGRKGAPISVCSERTELAPPNGTLAGCVSVGCLVRESNRRSDRDVSHLFGHVGQLAPRCWDPHGLGGVRHA